MLEAMESSVNGGFSHLQSCGDSSEEELSVLPRHTKVVVTGNNRTKSVLVGLQGVVKKAVGLGGWHWLVLTNGIEVKLQRNALSVIEAPTGNEEDDDLEFENMPWNGSDMASDDTHKSHKSRHRMYRTMGSSHKTMSRSFSGDSQSKGSVSMPNGSAVDAVPNPSKEQLVDVVQRHFMSQTWMAQDLDSIGIITEDRDLGGRDENGEEVRAMESSVNGGFSHLQSCGDSSEEELSVLPRHTKVVVTGNNRTKSVLVGLQGVVKKAVGLGGWHWLVLTNGIEVKLQRNALSVIEAPTGNEEDDDLEFENMPWNGSDMASDDTHKSHKSRHRMHRTLGSSHKTTSRSFSADSQSKGSVSMPLHGSTVDAFPNPSKEQLVDVVQRHFMSQQMDELQVIVGFVQAAKRLKTVWK
ncbi:hypothetical protein JHK86_008953 [Glycine max]|nr:hypothetical protein JHK86_008953 [Glycine max]